MDETPMLEQTTLRFFGEPEGRASLFKKMAGVMADVKRVAKSGQVISNSANYKYETAADVADEVRVTMAKHNLAFIPSFVGDALIDNRIEAVYDMMIGCGDTGAYAVARVKVAANVIYKSGAFDDKGPNKNFTTACKFFLMRTFIMSAGDDVEGDQNINDDFAPANEPVKLWQRKIHTIEYALTKTQNKPFIKCTLDDDEPASAWSREMFVEAGAIPSKDLIDSVGTVVVFDPPIIANVKSNGSYLNVESLEPCENAPALQISGGSDEPAEDGAASENPLSKTNPRRKSA